VKVLHATLVLVGGLILGGGCDAGNSKSLETPNPVQGKGGLVFSILDRNLGDVRQETIYKDIQFPFEVSGNSPVTITVYDLSCGCTEAKILVDGKVWPRGEPLLPGMKGMLSATFDAARYKGQKTSSITLRGEGADLPAQLTLNAFVKPHFELQPTQARFGEILVGRLRESDPVKEIQVTASGPFEIIRWRRLPKGIVVEGSGEPEEAADGSQVRRFKIRVTENAPEGRLYSSALAETTLGHNLEILIHAQVQGPVRYYPSNRLWFGMQDQGQARTMTVRCLAATDSVSLQTPEALFKGSDAFSIQVVEKKPGEEYLARVRLGANASVGRHNGILEIKWPEETGLRSFEIPISSIVRTAP
jgi:hypothetical protein